MQNRILIGVIAIITFLYWMILLFEINLFQILPDFFWHFMHYTDKPLSLLWLFVPLAILLYFVISYILKNPENLKRNILLIIIMGYIIQMSFGYMEGLGIDGLRQRMVTTGHSEFVKIAAMAPDMKKVAVNYESTLGKAEELKFVQTKPPGQLLFYIFTLEAANGFKTVSDPEENFITLVTFSAYIYPLLTYLVIIPLFYISRIFLKAGAAYLPCILYLFIPSVTLVTLHLDQVLYPLLFITGLLLIINGCKKDKMILSILSGVFIYFVLYFSFSLLPIIPLGLMFGASYIYSDLASDNKIKSLGRFVAGLIIGWISAYLLFWFLLDYNVFVRYQNAMAFHQAWKQWESGLSNIALYGFVNYIEFVCWMGLPISILFLASSRKKITELIKKQFNLSNLLYAIVILVFLLLGIFGKTKSEVGRLWIFMIPLILIFVSTELQDRFNDKLKPALWFILSFQLITILFIKRFQDFW